MPSFDIVSRVDLQQVDNAVNIARKEVATRYDFRGSKTELTLDKKEKKIFVVTEDDMKLRALRELLIGSLVRRGVDPKVLSFEAAEPTSHGMLKTAVEIREGIDRDTARSVVKLIKDLDLKVQASIQEDQVRVTAKKIDDLQHVIQTLKAQDLEVPLQFENMRS